MAQRDKKANKAEQTGSTTGKAKKFTTNVKTASRSTAKTADLLYGKDYYMWMLIGLACIILGFILMGGGNQAPGEWNADEIYSFRRTALAPIVIVIGLAIEVYAIFKK